MLTYGAISTVDNGATNIAGMHEGGTQLFCHIKSFWGSQYKLFIFDR